MKQTNNRKPVKRIITALLVLVLSAGMICSILALLIVTEKIPEQWGGVLAEVILELAVFAVCFATVRPQPRNRLPVSALTAAAFLLLRVVVKSAAFPQAQWTMLWGMAASASAALLAGMIAGTKKQRRR